MHRGVWQATVHGAAKSHTQLSNQHYNYWCVSIPKSDFIPSPIFPLVCFMSGSLFLFYKWVHLYQLLDSTYKQWHIFVFLWLTSLSTIISRSIQIAQRALFHSFLWLSNIPLCVCVRACHSFFIHSSVDGHLLNALAIVNSASTNTDFKVEETHALERRIIY